MAADERTGWPTFPLTEVFDVRSGLSKPASEFGTGFPFVTFKDVLDNYFLPETLGSLVRSSEQERQLCDVRRGDVFLTRTSETQEDLGMSSVALRGYEGATFNGFTKRLRPKDPRQVIPEYAAYFLRSPRFRADMSAFSSLSTRASLNNDMLGRLRIVLPEVGVQEAIGYTLRSLDDKIEQNRRTAAKLEGLARATFRAWFVDFAPVRAKAAGAMTYPGLPPAAFAALPTPPEAFTDSLLGPIPQGWEVKPLRDVVKLTMGQSPSSEYYNETGEGLPFHQGVSDHGFRFPSRRVYCTVEGRIAEAGDVLLSVRAPVGRINVADTRMVLGRGLAGMRHKQGHQSFLLYLMQHHFAEDDAVGDGTIYKAVNKDFLDAMPLITPNRLVEASFEEFAAPMDALIASLTRESDRLAALRHYLLPRLLSGSVRVYARSAIGGAE